MPHSQPSVGKRARRRRPSKPACVELLAKRNPAYRKNLPGTRCISFVRTRLQGLGALRFVVWLLGDYQPPTPPGSATLLLTVIMLTVMNIIMSAVMIKNIEIRPGI